MENFKHNPTDTELETIKRLVDKSIQSFHLAIELYNRPTLPNRVEACSMMLANAWELLLKAYLIRTKGESGIFYKDKPNRSLALSEIFESLLNFAMIPLTSLLMNTRSSMDPSCKQM